MSQKCKVSDYMEDKVTENAVPVERPWNIVIYSQPLQDIRDIHIDIRRMI